MSQIELSAKAKQELVPNGKLRAGMNLGNTLFTSQDASGKLHGVSVDLMQELATRIGVPIEMVVYAQPGQVADDSAKDLWDVAILAIEKTRAQTISFSIPMTEIEAGYVVHEDSPLERVEEVDANGVSIAAPSKAGYELYLTSTLKHASLVRTSNFANSIDVFNQRGVDVLSGLKPNLIDSMSKLPNARLLDGNFMVINHSLSTPLGRPAAHEYLRHFIQDLIDSGFIVRSIEKHQIVGLKGIKS